MNCVAIIAQMGIKRQPVVFCRFHAEYYRFIEASYHIHKLVVTSLRIGKAHGLADNTPILSDYGCLAMSIPTNNIENTSKTQIADSPLNEAGQNLLGHAKIAEMLRHPAHK